LGKQFFEITKEKPGCGLLEQRLPSRRWLIPAKQARSPQTTMNEFLAAKGTLRRVFGTFRLPAGAVLFALADFETTNFVTRFRKLLISEDQDALWHTASKFET
jgi:hypothetical protein